MKKIKNETIEHLNKKNEIEKKRFYTVREYFYSCDSFGLINHIKIECVKGYEIKKNEYGYKVDTNQHALYASVNRKETVEFAKKHLYQHYHKKIEEIKEMIKDLPIVYSGNV